MSLSGPDSLAVEKAVDHGAAPIALTVMEAHLLGIVMGKLETTPALSELLHLMLLPVVLTQLICSVKGY